MGDPTAARPVRAAVTLIAFLLAVLVAAPAIAVAQDATPAAAPVGTPATAEEIADLRDRAIDLRSIDPADDDFADLRAWGEAIGDARIVMLGEPTHADGAAFLAKARLVTYLHQELGFDVLAFESGFYDCHKAQRLIEAGEEPAAMVRQCVHPIWGFSEQFRPTAEYVAEAAATDRPLTLTGFDSRFTDAAGPEGRAAQLSGRFFLPDLDAFLDGYGSPLRADPAAWGLVERLVVGVRDREYEEIPSVADQEQMLDAASRLRREIGQSGAAAADAAFWDQALGSVAAAAESSWGSGALAAGPTPAVQNIRDRQMADNLLWLAGEEYAGRKIVVWAATYHIARNHAETEGIVQGLDIGQTVPMGHLVWDELGEAVYALGVTSYGGEYGFRVEGLAGGEPPSAVPPPPPGSLEDILHAAGLENAIVDLQRETAGGAWLRQRRPARWYSYEEYTTGDWTRVLDGVLFIETMTPNLLVPPPGALESAATPAPDPLASPTGTPAP